MVIFFIDDESRRMETYIDELKDENYEVVFESNIDQALDFFQENRENIGLLILDVMMPTGKNFNVVETDNGLRTGICLHDKIRKDNPSLPIIILTNVSDQDLEERINSNSGKSFFMEKEHNLPSALVEKVKEILEP